MATTIDTYVHKHVGYEVVYCIDRWNKLIERRTWCGPERKSNRNDATAGLCWGQVS